MPSYIVVFKKIQVGQSMGFKKFSLDKISMQQVKGTRTWLRNINFFIILLTGLDAEETIKINYMVWCWKERMLKEYL